MKKFQKELSNSTNSKVKITYEINSGGSIKSKELPFKVLVISDLKGINHIDANTSDLNIFEISKANFIEVLGQTNSFINWEKLSNPSEINNFTSIESSWLGLYHLVSNFEGNPMIKINAMHIDQPLFINNLKKDLEANENKISKKLFEFNSDLFNLEPFSLLLANFNFDKKNDSEILVKLKELGDALNAPIICLNDIDLFAIPIILNKINKNPKVPNTFHLAESVCSSFVTSNWPVAFQHQLSSTLVTFRFVNYLKIILRNKIGSFLTKSNIENYLNTWICNYVLIDENPMSEKLDAAYPLNSARVIINDKIGEPGSYSGTLFIKPRFKLDWIKSSIKVDFDLPI